MKSLFLLTFVLSITMLVSNHSLAKSVIGEGRFYSKDDDSLSFIKGQLFYNASKDIITKEMVSLGLDTNLFWQKYNEKFDSYFTKFDDQLRLKYGLVTPEEVGVDNGKKEKILTPKQLKKNKEEYERRIRIKRLLALKKYGNLSRVVQSYSVKKRKRSVKFPNSRYLSIEAKVNRKKITNLYRKFVSERTKGQYSYIILDAKFNITNTGWSEVGSTEHEFVSTVISYWEKWLKSNMGNYFSTIVVADAGITSKLKKYIAFSSNGSEIADEDFDRYQFDNSLYLKLTTNINKEGEIEDFNSRNIQVSSEYVLLDIKKNSIVSSGGLYTESLKLDTTNMEQLSSKVASSVYKLPLQGLTSVAKAFAKMYTSRDVAHVTINNVESITELFSLMEIMTNSGITLGLNVELESIKGRMGRVKLDYSGGKDKLEALLNSLDKKILRNKKIVNVRKKSEVLFLELSDGLSEIPTKGKQL